jgi:hypothetical protein
MTSDPEKREQNTEKHQSNLAGPLKSRRIISYNLREEERPGGMKIRFTVRVETGKKAAAIDSAQADALRELLLWARQHKTHQSAQ